MCYDISFTVDIKKISDYFPDLVWEDQIKINFPESVHIQGHGYQNHPIIFVPKNETAKHLKLMEWGIIPFYIKDEAEFIRKRATMLNIRSEKILDDTKSYWNKIRSNRCLVPVSGFYEHRDIPGWKKKLPYYIQLKEQETFFLPGLYSVANLVDKETGEVYTKYTFGIVTRNANAVMQQIHNCGDNAGRMPLLLSLNAATTWLNNELSEEEYKMFLSSEMPSEQLTYYTVDTIRTQKMRGDGKAKNEHFEWQKVPELEF